MICATVLLQIDHHSKTNEGRTFLMLWI